MTQTPLVTWITDSNQKESVHRNKSGLTYEQSYIGHLVRKVDQDGDLCWGYEVNGYYTFAKNYAKARAELEQKAVDFASSVYEGCNKCSHETHGTSCQWGMGCLCKGSNG